MRKTLMLGLAILVGVCFGLRGEAGAVSNPLSSELTTMDAGALEGPGDPELADDAVKGTTDNPITIVRAGITVQTPEEIDAAVKKATDNPIAKAYQEEVNKEIIDCKDKIESAQEDIKLIEEIFGSKEDIQEDLDFVTQNIEYLENNHPESEGAINQLKERKENLGGALQKLENLEETIRATSIEQLTLEIKKIVAIPDIGVEIALDGVSIDYVISQKTAITGTAKAMVAEYRPPDAKSARMMLKVFTFGIGGSWPPAYYEDDKALAEETPGTSPEESDYQSSAYNTYDKIITSHDPEEAKHDISIYGGKDGYSAGTDGIEVSDNHYDPGSWSDSGKGYHDCKTYYTGWYGKKYSINSKTGDIHTFGVYSQTYSTIVISPEDSRYGDCLGEIIGILNDAYDYELNPATKAQIGAIRDNLCIIRDYGWKNER